MMYEDLFNRDSFPITDIETPGESVEDSLLRTLSKLHYAVHSGKRHWVITYSGGKDSTLLTVIACEIIRRSLNWKPDSIDIVYCDTLEEIPPMHQAALEFLNYIDVTADEEALPIHTHITQPAPKEAYWYLMLGKGYPAPHRRFWWCTERLKINPVKRKLAELNHHQDGTAVLTGVRFGESDRRDGKMRKASQCMGEGECGQVLKYQGALAPIVHWKTCQVWDFLALMASSWGWPTHMVAELYGDAPIRFGCWVCTLIDRDQALDAVTKESEWEYLSALAGFKQKILDATADPEARVTRPNGVPGKFKVATKKKLLRELEELQERTGLELISPDEERRIRHYWETDDKGDSY